MIEAGKFAAVTMDYGPLWGLRHLASYPSKNARTIIIFLTSYDPLKQIIEGNSGMRGKGKGRTSVGEYNG